MKKFISGPATLQVAKQRFALSTTIHVSDNQIENLRAAEATVLTEHLQSIVNRNHVVLVRANFESSRKGEYFGKVILQYEFETLSPQLLLDAQVKLKIIRKNVTAEIKRISRCGFRRSDYRFWGKNPKRDKIDALRQSIVSPPEDAQAPAGS